MISRSFEKSISKRKLLIGLAEILIEEIYTNFGYFIIISIFYFGMNFKASKIKKKKHFQYNLDIQCPNFEKSELVKISPFF